MMRILEAHPLAAERAAAGLNPANCVLLRGCGSRIQVHGCWLTARSIWRQEAVSFMHTL
jgi:2,3-bisphosphoglycerate-independent phosphoglycerate mutase